MGVIIKLYIILNNYVNCRYHNYIEHLSNCKDVCMSSHNNNNNNNNNNNSNDNTIIMIQYIQASYIMIVQKRREKRAMV